MLGVEVTEYARPRPGVTEDEGFTLQKATLRLDDVLPDLVGVTNDESSGCRPAVLEQ
jgi:hypothetical protein